MDYLLKIPNKRVNHYNRFTLLFKWSKSLFTNSVIKTNVCIQNYNFFERSIEAIYSTKHYMDISKNIKLSSIYKFENRIKNYKKVCFVLVGYKNFLHNIVFKRIKEFIPSDVEVCLLSSGKYSDTLSNTAKENAWSYLSTAKNNVSLIQNIAIQLYENAEYIYKLDEDIFVTKGFFDTLFNTMQKCENSGEYKVGFVAPTIPVNGFGHKIILNRFNLEKVYEEKFEKPLYATGRDRMIENNPEVAKFMWGIGHNYLPNIDSINNTLQKDKFSYVACPIRFSIGAILFKKELLKQMGMLKITSGSNMGIDESQMCCYCISNSKAIIVSKNTAVGHLSFEVQNKAMEECYKKYNHMFEIHD